MSRPTLAAAGAALLALGGAVCFQPSVAGAADAKAGKEKAAMCRACHGLNGVAVAIDAPNIAGDSEIYLERQLKAYRSGERKHEQMSVIAEGLDDADIADLVAWYSSIKITARMPP
ncbi:MAG TPA: cytochrome c [Geminicoccaceae bacterium]